MLRISKLADYGMVIMNILALAPGNLYSAKELSQSAGIGLPTVSKLLKILLKAELVKSLRGSGGGYRLSRSPEEVTIAEVIAAIEGTPALTECAAGKHLCAKEAVCAVRNNWLLVNRAILQGLQSITLLDMTRSMTEHPVVLHGIKLQNNARRLAQPVTQ